ncbi:hypothetical protein SAMN04488134_101633 [Amphibacillus marinus]|uniref:Uncharacterized protein n=1 Tax=Amphibacillus marinus TaxID=872970 RepID=A0A1H8IJN1_9BACI|nr:hypothetical protein [Amphibacillus marinus]SEN68469.1 hypothetical protein SAMN04488134_101633 [Amphibacillus marinus]
MTYLAILAAGVFFFLAASICLYMFFRGFGKGYLVMTIVILILVYFIIGLWNQSSNSLNMQFFTMLNG